MSASNRLRLYELPAAFRELDGLIDAMDGELPDDVGERLDALEATLEERTDAVCGLVREATVEADGYGAEIARLQALRIVAGNRAARLKTYLHGTLEALGRDRVDTGRFKVRVQRNSAASIRWTGDPDDLPDNLKRVTVELDGRAAQLALKSGTLPDGFEVSIGTHLRIS